MGSSESDRPERARRALNTIHEAREAADVAVDAYVDAFYAAADPDDDEQLEQARTTLHKAVIRFYNRMRPYLIEANEHDRVVERQRQQAFKLSTLEKWRTPSKRVATAKERVGLPDETVERTGQMALPASLALSAYDELNAAFVSMQFGAEPGGDVPVTDMDEEAAEAVGPDEGDGDDSGDEGVAA
jgi:hypothetical protein